MIIIFRYSKNDLAMNDAPMPIGTKTDIRPRKKIKTARFNFSFFRNFAQSHFGRRGYGAVVRVRGFEFIKIAEN